MLSAFVWLVWLYIAYILQPLGIADNFIYLVTVSNSMITMFADKKDEWNYAVFLIVFSIGNFVMILVFNHALLAPSDVKYPIAYLLSVLSVIVKVNSDDRRMPINRNE